MSILCQTAFLSCLFTSDFKIFRTIIFDNIETYVKIECMSNFLFEWINETLPENKCNWKGLLYFILL